MNRQSFQDLDILENKRHFLCGFKATIQNPNHFTIGHIWTIQTPDLFGFQIIDLVNTSLQL